MHLKILDHIHNVLSTKKPDRYRVLPTRGTLLISTDLHGNLDDFKQLRDIFYKELKNNRQTYWVILGDIVHGPNYLASMRDPELYGYPDQSWEIASEIVDLQKKYSKKIYYVLGNHDHGHIGGRRTQKFYSDEVEALESKLEPQQIEKMRNLFYSAFLAVVAPCGALLTHGSPDESLKNLDDLEHLSFTPEKNNPEQAQILETILWHYGQREYTTQKMLKNIKKTYPTVNMVIHGHDRDPKGYFTEGKNQLCPVIFGASRGNKSYIKLNLAHTYSTVHDIRLERELLCLYPPDFSPKTN